mgnify:CR=1 FL=1
MIVFENWGRDVVDYFLHPKKTGYDVPKTLTYALVLVVAAYLVYRLLKILKIKIDQRLAVALAPYVAFGGAIRVLQDAGLLHSYLFVTPGIYFFIFFVVLTVLLFSLALEKKGLPYFKTMFVCGLLLLASTLPQLTPINFYGAFLVLLFFSPWLFVFSPMIRWSKGNKAVVLLQLFDATTTFVALNFFGPALIGSKGFVEQHILPTFLINIFGPVSFIVVKLFTVVIFLVLIDRFSTDKEFNRYLKLIIGILGGATGSRDFIALLTMIG